MHFLNYYIFHHSIFPQKFFSDKCPNILFSSLGGPKVWQQGTMAPVFPIDPPDLIVSSGAKGLPQVFLFFRS